MEADERQQVKVHPELCPIVKESANMFLCDAESV